VIRINRVRQPSTTRLIVAGTLCGDWVAELERCWIESKAASLDEQIRVELAEVSYIDDRGKRLLKQMFREGVELRAKGVMTRGIVEEITEDGKETRGG
jgi:hypothetical protein